MWSPNIQHTNSKEIHMYFVPCEAICVIFLKVWTFICCITCTFQSTFQKFILGFDKSLFFALSLCFVLSFQEMFITKHFYLCVATRCSKFTRGLHAPVTLFRENTAYTYTCIYCFDNTCTLYVHFFSIETNLTMTFDNVWTMQELKVNS